MKIEIECKLCGATGVYRGFVEAPGEAVVCLGCNGTGCAELTYTPFVRRQSKRGIKTVRRSSGRFIGTGVGAVGDTITYKEFKEGKMPQ